MAEFREGNRELADLLGTEVIGEPLSDEMPIKSGKHVAYTLQVTSRGVMLYFPDLPGQGQRGSQFVAFSEVPQPDPAPAPEPARPAILNTDGGDIRPLLETAIAGTEVSLRLILAGVIAESGLNPRAERWGGETAQAKTLLAIYEHSTRADDVGRAGFDLQQLIERVWPDISFSYGQRVVAYHWAGTRTLNLRNVLEVRATVFADPARDLREMAVKLQDCLRRVPWPTTERRTYGDLDLAALIIYNAGHYPDLDNPWWENYSSHVASYRAALARAEQLI